ncbi:MAG: hypothetical protein PUG22_04550 [Peptoniphilaceae bacterium]|nr:hypothetical protein [Peptoniphilaceae bacterium]
MFYKVIRDFEDLKDNNKKYKKGDIYTGSRKRERIKELSSDENVYNHPFIVRVSSKVYDDADKGKD